MCRYARGNHATTTTCDCGGAPYVGTHSVRGVPKWARPHVSTATGAFDGASLLDHKTCEGVPKWARQHAST
eukprot:5303773-Pyramimonas_sp.AAC.1